MRRSLKWLAMVVAALVVLVAAGIVYLVVSDTTTPVEVEEAVDRYRGEQGASAGSTTTIPDTPAMPAEGVYIYATEGEERIDILSGSTHTYPAETTVTISHTDCGLRQRWDPLGERWDEEEVCVVDAGRERHRLRTHHEFFGMSDEQDFSCDSGYLLLPAQPEVGDTWSTSCQSGGTRLTGTGEVVAFETRQVGGDEVETIHVRISEEASGSNTGPSSDDYWWRTTDGLLIERTSAVETSSDSPVGSAKYTERFALRLTSLTPRT